MDTRDLRVFAAVYETKSISRAAKDLYLSPQGCSKIIQKLESELGASLFGRFHFGVRPTPQADALYRNAQAIIDILDGIKDDIARAQAMKYALTIASTQGISEYLSMLFMRDFTAENPLISLRILESPDSIAKARVLNREAELGILGGPVDLSVFHAVPFTRHRPCLVMNRENPLAAKARIAYADLENQPLALVGREFGSYHLIVNRLMNEGVHPDIVMEATEINLCHLLAEEGEAIAVSFDFTAWVNVRKNTVIRPFDDRSFFWETYLVHPADSGLSSQAQQFCDFSTHWLKEHESDLFQWPQEE